MFTSDFTTNEASRLHKLDFLTDWIGYFRKQSIEKLLWINQLDLDTFAENEGSIFHKKGRRISIKGNMDMFFGEVGLNCFFSSNENFGGFQIHNRRNLMIEPNMICISCQFLAAALCFH